MQLLFIDVIFPIAGNAAGGLTISTELFACGNSEGGGAGMTQCHGTAISMPRQL